MNNNLKKIPFYPLVFLIKLTINNGGFSINRWLVFVIYIVRSFILEPFRLLEVYMYQNKIEHHKLKKPPIFILGHWRSGTSHLQNLMLADATNTSISIYSAVFSDNFFVTEFWLKKPLNFFCRLFKMEYSIQRIPLDLNIAAELDLALYSLSSSYSYTRGHIFPKKFKKWFNKLVLFEDKSLVKGWVEDYDFMIKKLSYQSNSKQVVVKSPGDTARVSVLLEKYPDAKFIYIHRDPIAVYHSNQYLWKVILKKYSVHKMSEFEIKDIIISTYKKLLTSYLSQRKLIPDSQLIEVNFEDLQQKTLDVIKSIYLKLGLSDVPEKEVLAFVVANQSYKTNKYQTPPNLENELKQQWDFAFKAWSN